MDVSDRLITLLRDGSAAELGEGALLLAKHANPAVDLAAETDRLDRLAGQCTEPTLDGVRRLLFRDLGFTGDSGNYHDPANSLLPSVLDRRRGLPITLSVLMIEVGRRVGAPMDGVGMPGHFLVRDRVLPDVFVDPFHGGVVLDPDECAELFSRLTGMPFDPSYLDPTPVPAILARMVANLVSSYARLGSHVDMLWAARLRSLCPDVSPQEKLGLAQVLAKSAAFDEAAQLAEAGAGQLPDDVAAGARRLATEFRARLN